MVGGTGCSAVVPPLPGGAGDDLQQEAVGVVEVDAAADVPVVDAVRFAARRVGPARQARFTDAADDLVELGFAHQERVVLRFDLCIAAAVDVVERGLADLNDHRGTEQDGRLRQTEDLGQEARRTPLVARVDDGVVEADRHRSSA